jgi:hypothetical protein
MKSPLLIGHEVRGRRELLAARAGDREGSMANRRVIRVPGSDEQCAQPGKDHDEILATSGAEFHDIAAAFVARASIKVSPGAVGLPVHGC